MSALGALFSAIGHALGGIALGVQLFFASALVLHTPNAPASTQPNSPAPAATSTLAGPMPPGATPVVVTRIATSSTSVRASISVTKPATHAQPQTSQPIPQPIVQTKTIDEVNADTRAALVNVLCTTGSGGSFEPISGSGIIITTNGVVLTNAHVGQYFLLHDYPTPGNVQCILRTGSPAQPKYTARLLYLSPLWIAANASQITASHGTGTGENDYALLLITGTTDSTPLPTTFPAVTLTLSQPDQGDSVFLAGYPAGFLDGQTIQMSLYQTSTLSTVRALYSFSTTDHVDLISVGGTVLSQSGASGGTVVRPQDGALEAIIATATAGTTTSDRDLRAITLYHIDQSLRKQTSGGLADLLTGDLSAKADDFAKNIAPTLTKDLTDVLNKR